MKKQMFKSALSMAAAIAAGSAFAAVASLYTEDFESPWTTGDLVTTDAQWTASGANDASAIAAGNNGQVLELKTEGDTLTNSLAVTASDGLDTIANEANTAISGGEPVTFEAEIKFVPSDSLVADIDHGTGSDTKFALYAYAPDGGNATNLVVYHASADENYAVQYVSDIISGTSIDCEAFTKVSVKMFSDANVGDGALYFTVTLGNTAILPGTPDQNAVDAGHSDWFMCVNDPADDSTKALSAICFKGTGMVDNLAVKTGEEDVATTFSVAITAPQDYTLTGVTVDGDSVTPAWTIENLDDGAVVVFSYTNADGIAKTKTVEVDGEDVEDAVSIADYTWADYLGDAVSGAYEIDDLAELVLFQKGVAAGLPTANTTFKLTDNVALVNPWPGIGLQNGKDSYSTDAFNAAAFCGTFDGQNHTISGFKMVGVDGNPANEGKTQDKWEGLDYCGFFNSTYGATIQNLKIQYAGAFFAADTTSSTKESGATFVGVAKNSTLCNLTTVAGTVSCSKGFGGIVGYLTSGTLVDSCTNNVNMTSLANNKCGGIAMIAQGGSAVTIQNCQNNGTQTTGSSNSEYGAIVGYIGLDITIANCETTVGRFIKHQGNTVTLQGVNKGDATVLAYHGAATPGLNFATVDGNVATFIADGALALNGSYKVLGPSATATFAFAEAGTISFDTNLTQNVTFAITAAEGLDLTDATVGSVVTFTAAAPAAAGWVDDVTEIADGTTAADQYADLAGTALAAADAKKLTVWAKANNVEFSDATSSAANYVEAFLLNCAATTAAVAAEKEAFVLTITFENGVPVVSTPAGKTYNGTVQLKGSTDLSTWTNVNNASADYNFYKCELTL